MTLRLLAFAGIVLLALAAGGAAKAQTYGGGYPVCLQSYAPIQFIDCRYTSIPQCQASASGRAAMCLVNPFFAEGQPPRGRGRR